MTDKFLCNNRIFNTIEQATAHAEFIFKISGIIVSIEKIVSPA